MTATHLRPCPACARHVRVSEDGCPFCGAKLAGVFAGDRVPSTPAARLSRAAMFALGTGAAAVTGACGESAMPLYGGVVVMPNDGGGSDDAGAPADAAGTNDSGVANEAGPDTGTTTAPYGGVPVFDSGSGDAGSDAGEPDDAGPARDAPYDGPTPAPPYGGVPTPPGGG